LFPVLVAHACERQEDSGTGTSLELNPRGRIAVTSQTKELLPSTPVRSRAAEIIALITHFCAEHLDDEYGALCTNLVRRLARERPSPLETGQIRVWVGAVLCAIGEVNFLFNPARRPHLKFDELSRLTGVSKSALATRARLIMCLLRIMPFEPEYCRREMRAQNPPA
jgi:hypothetical protein